MESQGCLRELVGRKKALLTCFKILEHQLKKLVSPKQTKKRKALGESYNCHHSSSLSLSLYMLHTLTAAFNSDGNPTELCFCPHVFLSAVVQLLLLQLQSTVKL
jgi:hypothetical protein